MSDTEGAGSEDTPIEDRYDFFTFKFDLTSDNLPPAREHAEKTREPQEWQTLRQGGPSCSA